MPSSTTSTTSSTPTARPAPRALQSPSSNPSSRIPVTPAVLRSIFASSRTPHEERSISRVAFFRYVLNIVFNLSESRDPENRFTGFLLSCLAISLAAARGRGIRNSAALLGVV